MASSDEDDIHQCGRCKETFTSIDEYFLHKKAKQCQKVSDPSKALSTVKGSKPAPHGTECSPDNTARPYRRKGRPRRVQAKSARSRTRPRDSSGEESVNRATKTGPAEGDAVLDRSNAMDEPPAEADEGREGGSVYSRKHLRRRCSAPKKAWVEDYQGEQEEQSAVRNSSSGKDDARNRSAEDAELIEEIAVDDSQENPAMDIQPETVALQEPTKRNLRQHRQRRKGFFDGRKSKGYSDKVMHSCPSCDYEVEHKDEFDRHLRRVHNLSNYVCPYCSSPFKDQYKLKRHLNQKRCKKMKDHKKKHISYAEFNASNKILNKVVRVAQEDECKEESGMAESENTFSCMQCEVTEATYEDICQHVKTEHPEVKPGICRFCGIWRMSKYRLWRHMVSSVHDNIDEDTLKAAKEELGSLDFSSEKVTLKRTRRCSTCPKAFPTKAILLQHVKSAHPQLPKQHICEHCGQEFTTKQQLAAHLRLSHAKKAARKTIPDGMQCPVCQRVFKQRSHMARHRESLHSPRQQVPVDVIAADHNPESTSEESQRTSPSVMADLAQKGNEEHPSIGKTCFVCCETLSNDHSKRLQHLHDHRVWRAHPEYGTQPPDLLEMMYSTNFIPAPTSLCSKTKKSTELEPGATSATNSAERQDDGSDPGVLAKASAEILATIRDGEKGEAATQQQIPLTTIDQSALSSLMHDQAMWEQVMFRDVDHAEETAAMAIGSVELNPDPVPPINIQPVAVAASGLVSDAVATVPEVAKMPETNSGLFEHTSSGIAEEMNLIRNEAMLEDHAYWSHNEQDMETTNSANSTAPEQSQELFLKSHEANDNGSASSSQACINESQEPPNTSTWNDRSLKQESFSRVDAQKETSAEESERNYICPYCLKVCETVSEIYWHKVNDHRLVSVFCCVKSNCHKTFESLKDYFEHSKEHSQYAFICGICNEHFEELRDTIVHKGSAHRNIHKMDGNRCNVCHRSFISKEALQEHARQAALHYQCSHCGKVMKTRAEQRDHELSHIGEESFLCDLCGATFVNKTTLSRHRLTHKTLRKHHCPQCDTVFNKPEHLRRHLQTKHSDEKPFKCPAKNCGRSFKRKDKLQAHKKMHSGDKPYSCDLCGRRYCYKDGLRYHEKTHKRANQYLCHTCQLPFPQPGQLMSHMVADHGLTIKDTHVHACQQCDKTFPRPERLKHHMERIHNVQPQWRVFCQVCKQGFPGNKSLETHMSKKHPMGRVELLSQSGRRRRKINRKITSDPAVVNASIQDVGKTEVKVTAIQDQRAVEQPLMDTIVVMDPNTGIQHQMSAQFFNTTLVNAGQEAPPQTTAAPANQSEAILGPAIGQQYQLVNLMQNKVSGFMPGERLPDNINASAATSVEATPTQTPTPGPVMEETQPLALLTNQVNPGQLTVALTANQNTLLTVNQKEATPSPPPGQSNALNAPSVIGEAQPPQQRYINLAHLPANVLNEIMTQLQTGNQGNPTQITLLPSHMTANSQVAPPNMTIQYTTDPNTYMNNY